MLSHMTYTDLNVHIGNHELLQCNNIKYLGVDMDNVLSWYIQTDNVSKKLVFIISRLSRLKPVLRSHMLMYIYTSIIQPKIDFAISIWGYTTAHNINKVQRLQNRAARILMGNYDYWYFTRATHGLVDAVDAIVVSHVAAVTAPTLLELCGAWPAVTPPTLL